MNRKEFIDEVMHYIVDKSNRPLIVEELNNHIDDRIECYLEQGFSLEEAEELAVKRMGSAQVIGNQMSALYDRRERIASVVALLILSLSWVVKAFLSKPDGMLDMDYISNECMLIFVMGLMFTDSKRFRSGILAAMSLATSVLSVAYILWVNAGHFVSSLVIYVSYALKGEISTITQLSNMNVQVIAGTKFVILSVILYALIIALTLANFIFILRSKTDSYSKKEMIAQKVVGIVGMVIIFVSFTMDCADLVFVLQADDYYDYSYALVYSNDKSSDYYADNYYEEYGSIGYFKQINADRDVQEYFDNVKLVVAEEIVAIDNDLSIVKCRYDFDIREVNNSKYVSLAKLKYKDGWVKEGEEEFDQISVTEWQSTEHFEFAEDIGYAEYVFHN